jgi:DNA-binding CsgD family transcriptional regulator
VSASAAAAERPLRESPFVPGLKSLSRCDLERTLEFVHATAAIDGTTTPFPEPLIEELKRLVPSDSIAYNEWKLSALQEPLAELVVPLARTPPAIAEARHHFCSTYPLSVLRLSRATRPCRLSDFISPRDLHRLDYYDTVLQPLRVEYQIRLWLTASAETSRMFCFNRSATHGDFSERDCAVLHVIRPYLIAMCDRFAFRRAGTSHEIDGLTARENEILEWVSAGKTNREIATLLVVSVHTVRKHLENVYAKLDVRTRTAAAARFLALRD